MLWGIDVSSHQKGIAVDSLPVDFVISKATEGTGYVNPDCDRVVQSCITNGISFGYYHYARGNSAHAECDYFYENTLGYHGKGIPVLDWEEDQSVEWVNAFVQRFHQKAGRMVLDLREPLEVQPGRRRAELRQMDCAIS